MASIRKREIQYKVGKDGNVRKGFAYDVYYSYKNPATGKLKRTSKKGFKTKEEAKAFLIEFENNKIRGTFRANTKLTVRDYLTTWLEVKKQSKATSTFVNYSNYVRKHISPHIGGICISELLSEDIIRLRKELLKPKYGLKKVTINSVVMVLSMALSDAVKQKIIVYNVARDIDSLKVQKKEVPIYDVQQIKKLLRVMEGSDLECPIALAAFCGLRRGEVLGLKWSDINEESKTMHIRQQVALIDDGFGLKELKTKSSNRIINIPNVVLDILNKQKLRQNTNRLKIGVDYNEHNLVCCDYLGRIMSPGYLSEKFGDNISRYNLPKITFHSLRHSYATIMLNQNAPLKIVSTLLGHARISTTADVYMKVVDEKKMEAAKMIDEVFLSGKDNCKNPKNERFRIIKLH